MADVTLKYKGATIGELSESGNKTIKTAGKYCEADILAEYVKPGGGGILDLQEIASYTVENNIARFNLLIPTDYQNSTVFVVALEGELQSADWVYVNPNASEQYKGGYFSSSAIKSYAHKIVFSKNGFLLPSNQLSCPYVVGATSKLVSPPITNFLFSTYSSGNFFLPSFKATIYGG